MSEPAAKKSPWYLTLHWQILLALVLGVVAGALFGESIAWIGHVGKIFVSFLKMVVMPLIFCSIVVAVAGLGSGGVGKLGARTIGYYFLTTALAVVIGLGLANLIEPGKGADLASSSNVVVAYEHDLDNDGNFERHALGDGPLKIDKELVKGEEPITLRYRVVFSDGGKEDHTVTVGGGKRSEGLLLFVDKDGSGTLVAPAGSKSSGGSKPSSMIEMVHRFIPSNPLGAMAAGDIMPTVIFAIILGLALMRLHKRKPVLELLDAVSDAMIVIVNVILKVTPIGVFALITKAVADAGVGVLQSLLWYCIAVVAGLGLQTFVVYPLLIRVAGGESPLRFFAGIKEAMLFAFSTASSSATLPVTMRCLEKNLKVPKRVTDFVLPLGATVNMDGTALYEAMAAMFVAQAYGIDLSIGEQVIVFLTANLAAIGAAGIPGAGLITLVLVLNAVGLPLEGLGIILAVDRILDMFRTATNVTGDGAVALIVGAKMPLGPEDTEPLEDPEEQEEPEVDAEGTAPAGA